MNSKVTIYTDGSTMGNPGPGGYCAILHWGPHKKIVKGNTPETTAPAMELTAAVKGIMALKRECTIELWTDSQYVHGLFEKNWQPKANIDIWLEMNQCKANHDITVHWKRGKTGDKNMDEAHKIAYLEALEAERKITDGT